MARDLDEMRMDLDLDLDLEIEMEVEVEMDSLPVTPPLPADGRGGGSSGGSGSKKKRPFFGDDGERGSLGCFITSATAAKRGRLPSDSTSSSSSSSSSSASASALIDGEDATAYFQPAPRADDEAAGGVAVVGVLSSAQSESEKIESEFLSECSKYYSKHAVLTDFLTTMDGLVKPESVRIRSLVVPDLDLDLDLEEEEEKKLRLDKKKHYHHSRHEAILRSARVRAFRALQEVFAANLALDLDLDAEDQDQDEDGDGDGLVKKMKKKKKRKVMKLVYHSVATRDVVEYICEQGAFNRDWSPHRMLGRGVYFGVDAQTAHSLATGETIEQEEQDEVEVEVEVRGEVGVESDAKKRTTTTTTMVKEEIEETRWYYQVAALMLSDVTALGGADMTVPVRLSALTLATAEDVEDQKEAPDAVADGARFVDTLVDDLDKPKVLVMVRDECALPLYVIEYQTKSLF